MNRELWAPKRVRVFLGLQFAGMSLLAVSTVMHSPLGLTLTIAFGAALLLSGIVLAAVHTWRTNGENDVASRG